MGFSGGCMRKKILLTLAVATALSISMVAYAETTPNYELEGIIVSADRNSALQGGIVDLYGNLGNLGVKKIENAPFSTTTITEKAMGMFAVPTLPLDKVLINDPAIRSAGSTLHNDFTHRGFRNNGTASLVNGVPGMMTQFNAPTFMMSKITLIDGPAIGLTGSGVQYESSPAGGVISYTTKRALSTPTREVTLTFTPKGSLAETIDIGKRFGENQEWGIRFNARHLHGETSVKGEKDNFAGAYVNIDHKGSKSLTNLFLGYSDNEITKGQRWFKLDKNVINLPKVPDASNDYGFDGMFKSSYGYVLVLNHEQQLTPNIIGFINGGINRNNLDNNVVPSSSAYIINNDKGDFDLDYFATTTPQHIYYLQAGLKGNFQLGKVTDNVVLSFDKSWRNRDTFINPKFPIPSKDKKWGNVGTGNLYEGLKQIGMPATDYKTAKFNHTSMQGITFVNDLTYEKWNLVLGLHHHTGNIKTYNKNTGALASEFSAGSTSPTIAVAYKPNDNTTIFANHSEYFDIGQVVATKYANGGEILPPTKTKQNEIGVKYLKDGWLATASYFDIKDARTIEEERVEAGQKKTYLLPNGYDHHKGIQASINGKLTDKWSIFGGAMYLDAKQENTGKKNQDGWRVSAQPRWSGVLGLAYAPNEKTNIFGRMTYFGDSIIRNVGKVTKDGITVPAYTVFDIGIDHEVMFGSHPATLSLLVSNVFNKNYWMASRGDQVYLSYPRTLIFTTKFKF